MLAWVAAGLVPAHWGQRMRCNYRFTALSYPNMAVPGEGNHAGLPLRPLPPGGPPAWLAGRMLKNGSGGGGDQRRRTGARDGRGRSGQFLSRHKKPPTRAARHRVCGPFPLPARIVPANGTTARNGKARASAPAPVAPGARRGAAHHQRPAGAGAARPVGHGAAAATGRLLRHPQRGVQPGPVAGRVRRPRARTAADVGRAARAV